MLHLEMRNVSHKNININNILLDHSGCWRLFGFAPIVWSTFDGSALYISPEEQYLTMTEVPPTYDMDYFKVSKLDNQRNHLHPHSQF